MNEKYSNTQLKLVTVDQPSTVNQLDKQETADWKEIRRERLINSLNRINFQNGEVVLNFRHQKYHTVESIPVNPKPCIGSYFECAWSDTVDIDQKLKNYQYENFHFTDGFRQIQVKADLLSINKNRILFILPETSREVNLRKVRRHKCKNVYVQLNQDGYILEGELVSFSTDSFSVNVPNVQFTNKQRKFNCENPVNILIKQWTDVIYSGECEVFRQTKTAEGKNYVLKPYNSHIQRFKSKKYRSIRQEILPSPNIIFNHPFTGRKVNLKVNDISGAGFSVEESLGNSLLLPGMIINDLFIGFLSGMEIKCKCQVIYRALHDQDTVKCGLTLLDMSLRDQVSLSSILHQANNKNAHVCTRINIEDLYDFFFESGFVYPHKYFFMHSSREKFLEVFTKLYEKDSDLAINFIYQNKGQIYGHMSMLRFYEKTWIINHHAANSSKRSGAGLVVLEQIGRYINELHRLPSTQMDYVACYFRPENKFPNLVFGGAARNSSNGCTVEEFGYMHFNKKPHYGKLPAKWSLSPATKSDLVELTNYYEKEFNKLSLKALDICPSKINCDKKINQEFNASGFKRERILFSLKDNEDLIAVFMVNVTELGMNMSDLTNCIHVFVINSDKLPSEKLYPVLSQLSHYYEHDNLPVLVFPKSYTKKYSIPIDKTYNFWVLDVEESSDEYFRHVEKLVKRIKK